PQLSSSPTLSTPTASSLGLHDALPILSACFWGVRPTLCENRRIMGSRSIPLLAVILLAGCTGPYSSPTVSAKNEGKPIAVRAHPDRKSTCLNSSHGSISYAVFCLK